MIQAFSTNTVTLLYMRSKWNFRRLV